MTSGADPGNPAMTAVQRQSYVFKPGLMVPSSILPHDLQLTLREKSAKTNKRR